MKSCSFLVQNEGYRKWPHRQKPSQKMESTDLIQEEKKPEMCGPEII
jgi:hypothetical protein